MSQLINSISQSATGFVLLLGIEVAALMAAVYLTQRGGGRYQDGQKLRAPLKIRAIRKEVKKGSSK